MQEGPTQPKRDAYVLEHSAWDARRLICPCLHALSVPIPCQCISSSWAAAAAGRLRLKKQATTLRRRRRAETASQGATGDAFKKQGCWCASKTPQGIHAKLLAECQASFTEQHLLVCRHAHCHAGRLDVVQVICPDGARGYVECAQRFDRDWMQISS